MFSRLEVVLSCHAMMALHCSKAKGAGGWGWGVLTLCVVPRYTRLVAKAIVDVDPQMRWCPKPGCESAIQGAEQGSTRGQGES